MYLGVDSPIPGGLAVLPVSTDTLVKTRLDETVTLRCEFDISANGARITWEKDGTAIATLSDCTSEASITSCDSDIPNLEKHGLDGNLNSGVSLEVRAITLEDDGNYECKVIASEGFGKSAVRLTVSSKYSSSRAPFP